MWRLHLNKNLTSLYESDTDGALTLFIDTDFNMMQQSHGMFAIAKLLVSNRNNYRFVVYFL